MDDALAIVLTLVTRGNRLSDEDFDWIDRQIILPPVPPDWPAGQIVGVNDAARLVFAPEQLHRIGAVAGAALLREGNLQILAMSVQPWYTHFVYRPAIDVMLVRDCSQRALQRLFGSDLPIWAEDYAKRYCFEPEEVRSWIEYVERHNTAAGWDPRPWPFVSPAGVLES
jgi:hypothetical protein